MPKQFDGLLIVHLFPFIKKLRLGKPTSLAPAHLNRKPGRAPVLHIIERRVRERLISFYEVLFNREDSARRFISRREKWNTFTRDGAPRIE